MPAKLPGPALADRGLPGSDATISFNGITRRVSLGNAMNLDSRVRGNDEGTGEEALRVGGGHEGTSPTTHQTPPEA